MSKTMTIYTFDLLTLLYPLEFHNYATLTKGMAFGMSYTSFLWRSFGRDKGKTLE